MHSNIKYRSFYKITNPVGLCYVGQTVNLKTRMASYKLYSCKKQYKIYQSLIKYGWDAHTFEVIEDGNYTQEEANEIEIRLILKYKQEGISLNVQDGGSRLLPMCGKEHHFAKKFYQIDFEGNVLNEFWTMKEAASKLKIGHNAISRILKKRGGYCIAGYFLFYDIPTTPPKVPEGFMRFNTILQLDSQRNVIREFNASKELEYFTGLKHASVLCSITEGFKNKGYYWEYKYPSLKRYKQLKKHFNGNRIRGLQE